MQRVVAFLRAINVGGHTVKMDQLRRLFESFNFSGVQTYIASGNVVFETQDGDTRTLEQTIEHGLQDALGFEVATFVHGDSELREIADYRPFSQARLAAATAFNVAFLKDAPDEIAIGKLMGLKSAIDDFKVHGREVYWLCEKKQSESDFSNAVLEKTLGVRSTLRGIRTIRKIMEKYFTGG